MSMPLDATGSSPQNKVVDEIAVVNPPTSIKDASFVVPKKCPFYKQEFSISLGSRLLVEGVDYIFIFRSISLSAHFKKDIYAGIMFINREFQGTVKMTYQAVGGDFIHDDKTALETTIRRIGAVRWVSYDQLVGVPDGFAPEEHMHDLSDLVSMQEVVQSAERIADEIAKTSGSYSEIRIVLDRHLDATNAHTARQVGLGNVQNLGVANRSELLQGVQKYVTADVLLSVLDGIIKQKMPRIDTSAIDNFRNDLSREVDNIKRWVSTNHYNRTQSDEKYSLKTHNHDDVYATKSHKHNEYALKSHSHEQFDGLSSAFESLRSQVHQYVNHPDPNPQYYNYDRLNEATEQNLSYIDRFFHLEVGDPTVSDAEYHSFMVPFTGGITIKYGFYQFHRGRVGEREVTVTFPHAFRSACYTVQLTRTSFDTTSNFSDSMVHLGQYNKYGFKMSMQNAHEHSNEDSAGFHWMAIGI